MFVHGPIVGHMEFEVSDRGLNIHDIVYISASNFELRSYCVFLETMTLYCFKFWFTVLLLCFA